MFLTISNVFRRAYVAIDNFLEGIPTHSFENGNRAYWSYYDKKRGKYVLHRFNGPSFFRKKVVKGGVCCSYKYYQFGRRHRVDGPAVVESWGLDLLQRSVRWFINDKDITWIVSQCLKITRFPEDVHLGILAERMADLNDFRLLDAIQEPVDKDNPDYLGMYTKRGAESIV